MKFKEQLIKIIGLETSIFIKNIIGYINKKLVFFIKGLWLPFALILYITNFKVIKIHTNRVGHLIHDIEIELKIRELYKKKYKIIVLTSPKGIANIYTYKYLSRYVYFINNKFIKFFFKPFTLINFTTLNTDETSIVRDGNSKYTKIVNEWGNRKPLFSVNQKDHDYLMYFLEKFGMRKTDWYVCIQNRSSNYSLNKDRRVDDYDQSYRNNSVVHYSEAIDEIIKRGGWVVRMGEKNADVVSTNLKIIDYSNYANKNDRLDMLLYANCKFVLCSSSGVINMSNMFGVPAAVTNIAPLSHIFAGPNYNICIPKLYKRGGKHLKFKEILNSKSANFRLGREFNQESIVLIENTSDEILKLTKEMFNLINTNGSNDSLKVNEELKEFKSHFNSNHYTYNGEAKVSSYFLKKYKHLI